MAEPGSSPNRTGAQALTRTLRRCVPGLLLATGISFFTSLASLLSPIYMTQVFDRVLSSGSLSTLAALTLIVFFAILLNVFLEFIRLEVLGILGNWLSRRLSLDALEAIVTRSLRDRGNAGQALRDINDLRHFMAGGRVVSAMEFLWSPLFFAVLFMLHPAFGVFALVSGAVMVAIGVLNEIVTHRPITEANNAAIRSYNQFGAALQNAEVIEAMGLMGRIARRWQASHDRTLAAIARGTRRANLITALSRALRMMVQVGTIGLGVVLALDNLTTAGSIFAAMIIMSRALAPFEQLIDGWRQWLHAWAAYRRLGGTFDGADLLQRSTMALPRPDGCLEADRLVFVPPGHRRAVVRGVSFRLDPGESLGILGPSGAGKSTLARLIVGLWQPTGGALKLDGHEVHLWNRESFGSYVGYVPQSVALFETTIRENIARFAEADPAEVVRAAKMADVHDLIGGLPLGYDTVVSDRGFSLTGGQRQRIALARALFGNPSLLVLDEPDSNLDEAGEAALRRAIETATAENRMVVVVTHRRSLLAALDKLLVLKDGALTAYGRREEILASLTGGNSGTKTPVGLVSRPRAGER
ncbi:type I secretion system permease/ATPase [Azospirillum sp.]|uniref:type I secretion system permease/ATPase n=1 Tax=Azospirillum sp. TaxID=34012 RepID=UPI002D6C449B|nr:type I secretion system permease/ATPase [Azospirillum sp.]HYD66544.1 type I secretion system permease/ATPase [Azospirillum sp.]